MVIERVSLVVNKEKLKGGVSNFQREFRKQLAVLVTGAFAFVAGLFWRDAIKSYIDKYEELIQAAMPIKETWFVQLFTAFIVSVVAIVAIIAVTKLLRVEDRKQ